MPKASAQSIDRAKKLFKRHGGLLRTSQALQLGVHPRTLYRMRDEGVLERLERGLYRLTELPPLGDPDLVAVTLKVPGAVICLVSALAYHELTTQVPHEVHIALPRGTERPRLKQPPVRVFWFAEPAFAQGIETHKVDNFSVRIYSPEKTLADCFKYRNKIGLDVAVEALRLYRSQRRTRIGELMRYARICRVEKIIRPYLEALP
jgi:predicted transcriptional regulator of viral defense system